MPPALERTKQSVKAVHRISPEMDLGGCQVCILTVTPRLVDCHPLIQVELFGDAGCGGRQWSPWVWERGFHRAAVSVGLTLPSLMSSRFILPQRDVLLDAINAEVMLVSAQHGISEWL